LPLLGLSGGRISWFVNVVRLAECNTASQRDAIVSKLALRGIEPVDISHLSVSGQLVATSL